MADEEPYLATIAPEPAPAPVAPPRNSLRAAIDNPWAVLILLFAVTGFLGLPVLWISRGFSTTSKVVWSIIVIIYTCALIAATVAIIYWAWQSAMSG